MLWEHSAAWMAVETFAAEQLTLPGHLPLVFELAGSRVAVAVAIARAKEAIVDMFDFILRKGLFVILQMEKE